MKILYLCADAGVPVLGRDAVSLPVREMIGAFARAGHDVTLAAPTLTRGPWEKPTDVPATVLHVPPSTRAHEAARTLSEFMAALEPRPDFASEVRPNPISLFPPVFRQPPVRSSSDVPLAPDLSSFARDIAPAPHVSSGSTDRRELPPAALNPRWCTVALSWDEGRSEGTDFLSAEWLAAAAPPSAQRSPCSLAVELRRVLYNRELAAELTHRLQADPPDFIYERASRCGTAGAALARHFGVPLLLELNAPLVPDPAVDQGPDLRELTTQAGRRTLRCADAVLATSEALRQHALSLGLDPEKVHRFLLGMNATTSSSAGTDVPRDEHESTGPVIGHIGSLQSWRGVEVLPDVLSRLTQAHAGVQLEIVGEGPLRLEFERSLRQRGLHPRVRYVGEQDAADTPALMRRWDVALVPLPSRDSATHSSAQEIFASMACGVAVVAADCGPMRRVVRDGVTGLLCPPGDVEALATSCDLLLRNPGLREALGNSAAQFVQKHFTWERSAARALDLARAAINEGKALAS